MAQHTPAPSPTPGEDFYWWCSTTALHDFGHRVNTSTSGIKSQMLRVNGLTLGNAILAGILIGIGTYGTRYRHRAFIRLLFQGASTLFLPILSYVASNASATVSTFGAISEQRPHGSDVYIKSGCSASVHLFLALIWAGLVHIVGIITCTVVATSDREGRNMGLPLVLLLQAIWTSYLVVSLRPDSFILYNYSPFVYSCLPTIFALIYSKMALKFYEFQKARRSVALGRNPLLIVGYMEQLQEENNCGVAPTAQHCPPPLIVMGENRTDVDKGAHGFFFKRRIISPNQDGMIVMNNTGLVTIDKIWLLADATPLLTSAPRPRDVCLSFALFKLLRCRFAGYTVAEAGFQEVYSFFLHVLLKDKDHERLYGVITDELSFLHDYYYSSTPIHYSNFWLPIVNMFTSFLTISYCLLHAGFVMRNIIVDSIRFGDDYRGQVYCHHSCYLENMPDVDVTMSFGNIVFDVIPVSILLVLVVLAEAREIASYISSNWTKVALVCHYVMRNHDKWQRSPRMRKWIGRIVGCRCKLMKHWDDKMNQCSVLALHPRRTDAIIAFLLRLLHLPDRKKRVMVPRVVKAAVVNALKINNGHLADPATFVCWNLQDSGDNFLWACSNKGISEIILMWHIATSITGERQQSRLSDDIVVATHLSRYCAYLVSCLPELLPDDDEWCKSLYMAVRKDSMRALAGGITASTEEDKYKRLISRLERRAKHKVLRNGVRLAKQLAELEERQGAVWRLLAEFWSQMILYISPSDNLNAHADAIARGGELITLVWALLMHVGVTSRPRAAGDRV